MISVNQISDFFQIKLLLSVVRAYDVPVRSDMDPLQSQSNLQLQVNEQKLDNLASFQDIKK